MKYTVKATYTTSLKVDIEAKNQEEAYRMASCKDLSEYEQEKDSGVLKLSGIAVSDANLDEEQLAFTEAYLSNVASANRDTVIKFLLAKDHDTFYEEHGGEYYSGLADARGVWYDAKQYFTKEKSE